MIKSTAIFDKCGSEISTNYNVIMKIIKPTLLKTNSSSGGALIAGRYLVVYSLTVFCGVCI